MHPNAKLIQRFYEAFAKRDAATMRAAYHPQARFEDPAFPGLVGGEIGDMWDMLCARGKDLKITFSDVEADDQHGSAHWQAWYSFSGTGNKVHNVIASDFEFRDGKIHRHLDRFSFWRWSSQALGLPGVLLGWSPMLRSKVQATAKKNLEAWRSRGR